MNIATARPKFPTFVIIAGSNYKRYEGKKKTNEVDSTFTLTEGQVRSFRLTPDIFIQNHT